MRGTITGPLAKTYPVSAAAEAVVRGIERRQPHRRLPALADRR